jgi:hypothetical protein
MNSQDNISFLKHQLKNTTELLEKAEAKQAAELAKPKSKRILVGIDSGFYVRESGCIFNNKNGFLPSICFIENDNAFIDEESAQLQAQRNTLVYRMRVAALDCPVDWSENTDKHYPRWNFAIKNSDLIFVSVVRNSQLPHFASKFKLEIFMNSLSTEEQKLLICGVE